MNDQLLEKLLIESAALSATERELLAQRLQRMTAEVPGFGLPSPSTSKPEASAASPASTGGK